MFIISPIDIATQGLLSKNGLTIATQGFIVFLEEEIIPVVSDRVRDASGGPSQVDRLPEEPVIWKKRITVTCIKDGKTYKQTRTTSDVNMTLESIKVKINEQLDKKPIIEIIFPGDN